MTNTQGETRRLPYLSRLPRRAYSGGYLLLGAVLLWALVDRWLRPVLLTDAIGIDRGTVAALPQGVDPNTAAWWELAGLPGIGEVTARRIVEHRRSVLADDPDARPVFRRPEDLLPVRGIGEKTIARLAPYLRFN